MGGSANALAAWCVCGAALKHVQAARVPQRAWSVQRTESTAMPEPGMKESNRGSRAGCSRARVTQPSCSSMQSSQRSRAETNTAHLLVHGIYGMGLILRFDEAGAICGVERTRQPRRRRHKRRAPEPGTLGSGLECG